MTQQALSLIWHCYPLQLVGTVTRFIHHMADSPLISAEFLFFRQSGCYSLAECTLDFLTNSSFLCYELLIEMIRVHVQNSWDIIIRNRCLRNNFTEFPMVADVNSCQRIQTFLTCQQILRLQKYPLTAHNWQN